MNIINTLYEYLPYLWVVQGRMRMVMLLVEWNNLALDSLHYWSLSRKLDEVPSWWPYEALAVVDLLGPAGARQNIKLHVTFGQSHLGFMTRNASP